MTPVAQAYHIETASTSIPAPGFITRLRRHFARIEAAMVGQADLKALQPETLRDTGLSPYDLTGAPSYDPALPFFFQAGFGCRNL